MELAALAAERLPGDFDASLVEIDADESSAWVRCESSSARVAAEAQGAIDHGHAGGRLDQVKHRTQHYRNVTDISLHAQAHQLIRGLDQLSLSGMC